MFTRHPIRPDLTVRFALCLLLSAMAGCGDLFALDSDTELDGQAQLPSGLPGLLGQPFGEDCSEADCLPGLVCSENEAICVGSESAGKGSSCVRTVDCAEDLVCSDNLCAAAGDLPEGGICQGTLDCERGLTCLPALLSGQAGLDNRCAQSGTVDIGLPCRAPTECLAGLACLPASAEGDETLCAPAVGGLTFLPPNWKPDCPADEGRQAYFRVPRGNEEDGDFYRLPFPNDLRRVDGGLDLSGHPHPEGILPVDLLDRYLRSAEQDLDGFSLNPVIYFRFSEPYDQGSANSGGEGVLLFDLSGDPSEPNFGRKLGRRWQTSEGPISKYVCQNWLSVEPTGGPLQPERSYAVVLTRQIKTPEGNDFARADDLEAMLSEAAPEDATLMAAHATYAPLRALVASGKLAATDILNAAVFTTQRDPGRQFEALRSQILDPATMPPEASQLTLCEAGTVSPCDDGEGRVCGQSSEGYLEVHGILEVPLYQSGQAPYVEPEDGGGFELDADGKPVSGETTPVCFALSVPRAAPDSAEGYPLVIYAHGTGGNFTGALGNGLAADAASAELDGSAFPVATLAIDMPQHGPRRAGSELDEALLFYNFLNPRAARDNVAQGSADLLSAMRWAGALNLDATGSPTGDALKIDPARVAMFGHSQGGTHLALIAPHVPLRAVVLSGVGGQLSAGLLDKTEPVNIASALPVVLLDPYATSASRCTVISGSGQPLCMGARHPALAILQTFFDAVDPLNFAARLADPAEGAAPANVLVTFGPGDSYTPESTTRAYAQAAGLQQVGSGSAELGLEVVEPPVSANVDNGNGTATQVLRQYTPPEDTDGHFVAFRNDTAKRDVRAFLFEALGGEVPAVQP